MSLFFWDTETSRFGPGRMAPPLVCVSYAFEGQSGLVGISDTEELLEKVLYDDEIILVGHNLAYDFGVVAAEYPRFLPQIFRAYSQNRVRDTMIRQKLLDIAMGRYRGYWVEKQTDDDKTKRFHVSYKYNLQDTLMRATKQRIEKGEDTWRLRYAELRNIPVESWPEEAKSYAIGDALAVEAIYAWQEGVRDRAEQKIRSIKTHVQDPDMLGDESRQCRAAWWIHLMQVWGIRTQESRVEILRKTSLESYQKIARNLMEYGLVREDESRNTKAAKARMAAVMGGIDKCRLTDKDQISLDEEACLSSGDMLLEDYASFSSLKTVMSKDIKALLRGCTMPIHSNFESIVATGRTSSSKPNIQNIRRMPGIRECFIPREGCVYINADYDGLELRTLAQVCLNFFGRSRLAEVLNAGDDPHLQVAAKLLKIDYEEAYRRYDAKDSEVDKARQLGKVANFGFPGGLGYDTFRYFAKSSANLTLSEREVRKLKENWLASYPEMDKYFQLIDKFCREDHEDNRAIVRHIFSGRIRGDVPYTVACNSHFQGLGADATKAAGFLVSEACYADVNSPLYGSRIVNYIHDEFLVEIEEARCHEGAFELARLMVVGASPFLPDVPPKVSKPLASRCWSKNAKQVWAGKRLVPWDTEFSVRQRDKRAG